MKQVDASSAKKMLDNKQAELVDVRELHEYQAMAIPGAILHPLSSIETAPFKPKKNKVIVYCRSGQRSLSAINNWASRFSDIEFLNLEGGILAWLQAGLSVTEHNNSCC